MPASTVGLVYSQTTGRLRSIVIPDNNGELIGRKLNSGESILIISSSQFATASADGLQDMVTATTGTTPVNDRYVFLKNIDSIEYVIAAVIADPVGCGDMAPPGMTLIAHDSAGPGHVRIGASFFDLWRKGRPPFRNRRRLGRPVQYR